MCPKVRITVLNTLFICLKMHYAHRFPIQTKRQKCKNRRSVVAKIKKCSGKNRSVVAGRPLRAASSSRLSYLQPPLPPSSPCRFYFLFLPSLLDKAFSARGRIWASMQRQGGSGGQERGGGEGRRQQRGDEPQHQPQRLSFWQQGGYCVSHGKPEDW